MKQFKVERTIKYNNAYLTIYENSILDESKIEIRKINVSVPYFFTHSNILAGKLQIIDGFLFLTYFNLEIIGEKIVFQTVNLPINSESEYIDIIYNSKQIETDIFIKNWKMYSEAQRKLF